MFIDDSARERENVRHALPDVTVLGEDLFSLRRTLLTDPGLQPVNVTAEASRRDSLVKAQLDRSRLRQRVGDETAFIASLQVVSVVERVTVDGSQVLDRVRELIDRTTQFNATGAKFTEQELRHVIGADTGRVFVLHMGDRLADHGLVGAAIVLAGQILNFVLSCRVIGLAGERALLDAVIADARAAGGTLCGRITRTERNIPARNLYSNHGFTESEPDIWIIIPPGVANEPVNECAVDV